VVWAWAFLSVPILFTGQSASTRHSRASTFDDELELADQARRRTGGISTMLEDPVFWQVFAHML